MERKIPMSIPCKPSKPLSGVWIVHGTIGTGICGPGKVNPIDNMREIVKE